jgi:perosamine synthetase
MKKIPVYEPSLLGNEKKYVLDCLDTNWISSKGQYIEKFERAFTKAISVKYGAAVCNGTAGLHLCMLALGIGPGDEVLVPTLTYVASANAIKYVGATPVFVDSDPLTWQINPKDIVKKISIRTKAILVVHLYGHPCDMNEIVKIKNDNSLYLIEDCAEAFGTLYRGSHVGGFGDIAMFSFFGNKTITTGEGGMVVTNDKTLNERVNRYKGQGLADYRQYWHDIVGYNYRMTNICAAIGLAQLEQSQKFLDKKRAVMQAYKEGLKNMPLTFHEEIGDVRHSYWMISILCEVDVNRDGLRKFLDERGIETRPVFYPIHTMPIFSDAYERNPVAEEIASRGLTLPSYPNLTDEDISYICFSIGEYLNNKSI